MEVDYESSNLQHRSASLLPVVRTKVPEAMPTLQLCQLTVIGDACQLSRCFHHRCIGSIRKGSFCIHRQQHAHLVNDQCMHAQKLKIDLIGIATDLCRAGMPVSIALGIPQQWAFVPILVQSLHLHLRLRLQLSS